MVPVSKLHTILAEACAKAAEKSAQEAADKAAERTRSGMQELLNERDARIRDLERQLQEGLGKPRGGHGTVTDPQRRKVERLERKVFELELELAKYVDMDACSESDKGEESEDGADDLPSCWEFPRGPCGNCDDCKKETSSAVW